jgi:hypothetical protein
MQYKITVYTGDVKYAGTNAQVYINITGEKEEEMIQSGDRLLDNADDNFQRGKVDQFVIDCRSLGELKLAHVWHSNTGKYPGWYLKKIVIEDILTGREWVFPCDAWLALARPPHETRRVLSVASHT